MRCLGKIALIAPVLIALATAQTVTAPGPAEIRVPNETIPPGGTVQIKFLLTEPRPIMTGTKLVGLDPMMMDAVFGVALWSPAGDVFGVARYGPAGLSVRYLSPLATFGTITDYPVLTIAGRIRPDAVPGTTHDVQLEPGSIWSDPLGRTFPFTEPKPGVITVGGSIAIHDVRPGGGLWMPGTVIKVLGTGFTASTKVKTKFKTTSVRVVSDSEIDLVLARPTEMTAQSIEVQNPDRSSDVYYSYIRGVAQGTSSIASVADAIAIFPSLSLSSAAVRQQSRGMNRRVVTAVGIQNPNAAPATVTLTASTPMGLLSKMQVTLGFGEKIVRELGEFFGRNLPESAIVRIEASAPVQLSPFVADELSGELTPFAPGIF